MAQTSEVGLMSQPFEEELRRVVTDQARRRNRSERIVKYLAGELSEDNIKAQLVQSYFHTIGFVRAERELYSRCALPCSISL
jgi:hypothetical protein